MERRKRAIRIGLLIFLTFVQLNAQDRSHMPSFRWLESTPFYMGERGEIVIELSDWNPRLPIPQGIFQGKVPLNVIISESSPLALGGGIYRYTITFIPLEERNIILSPFAFQHGDYTLNIPGINIQVRPARPHEPGEVQGETFNASDSEGTLTQMNQSQHPPFPQVKETPLPILQREYDLIIAQIVSLWEERLVAEALAQLRRYERDSLVGPNLVSLRREIEHVLGLGFTENEKWRPLGIPVISYLFFIMTILSLGVFFFVLGPLQKIRKKPKNMEDVFNQRKIYIIVIVSVLVTGFFLIFLEERLGNLPVGRFRSPGKTAVLRQTQGYRVPDYRGLVNDRFVEGQPVIVSDFRRDHQFDWYYAEAPDGRSGWVPREAVIIY